MKTQEARAAAVIKESAMARRSRPQWGNFGAICVDERGHLLTDAQFADLVQHHFANCDPALLPTIRAELNYTRQFYLKSLLYR
jgi:hypothetical protein